MAAILPHPVMDGIHIIECAEALALFRRDIPVRILSDQSYGIVIKICELLLVRIQIKIDHRSVFIKKINPEIRAEHILLRKADPFRLHLPGPLSQNPDYDQKRRPVLIPSDEHNIIVEQSSVDQQFPLHPSCRLCSSCKPEKSGILRKVRFIRTSLRRVDVPDMDRVQEPDICFIRIQKMDLALIRCLQNCDRNTVFNLEQFIIHRCRAEKINLPDPGIILFHGR